MLILRIEMMSGAEHRISVRLLQEGSSFVRISVASKISTCTEKSRNRKFKQARQ